MGNWASRDYDLDGSGTDLAEDNTPIGTHFNNANEWIKRNITTGGSPVTPLYDANGNLTDDGADYDYEYDAWNRLTAILVRNSSTVVAECRDNGLADVDARGRSRASGGPSRNICRNVRPADDR